MSIFLAAFIFTGVLVIALELLRVYRVHAWPKVPGWVVHAGVTSNTDPETGGTSYGLHVTYKYRIGQTWYEGTEDFPCSAGEQRAEELCRDTYFQDRELLVAYDPKTPEKSRLADELQEGPRWSIILGGVLFIGLALAIWWAMFR